MRPRHPGRAAGDRRPVLLRRADRRQRRAGAGPLGRRQARLRPPCRRGGPGAAGDQDPPGRRDRRLTSGATALASGGTLRLVTLEVVAIALTGIVHFLGAAVLVAVLLDGEKVDWRGPLFPRDDGRGWGPGGEPPSEDDRGDGGGMLAPTPLPDAAPSPVRLREPGRIREGYPRPARRPAHPPAPAPTREPVER